MKINQFKSINYKGIGVFVNDMEKVNIFVVIHITFSVATKFVYHSFNLY